LAGEAKSRPQLFLCVPKVFPEHLPDVVVFLKLSLLLVSAWALEPGHLIGNKSFLRLPKEVGRTDPHTTLASACDCCVSRGSLLGRRDAVSHGRLHSAEWLLLLGGKSTQEKPA